MIRKYQIVFVSLSIGLFTESLFCIATKLFIQIYFSAKKYFYKALKLKGKIFAFQFGTLSKTA